MQLLKIRKDLVGLVGGIEENKAELGIIVSYADEFQRRLEIDDAHKMLIEDLRELDASAALDTTERIAFDRAKAELLPEYQRRRIEAQLAQSRARVQHTQMRIVQSRMEICAFQSLLKNED